MRHRVGRREFLIGAAGTAAAFAAGCSSDPKQATPTTTRLRLDPAARAAAAKIHDDPFTLSVASGDPLTDRVILWTRLAPQPLAAVDGQPGVGERIDVAWEIATDDRFTRIVTQGTATAEARHAHSVHVDATGLEPATNYHYRFSVGRWTSPVGRTRTLPVGSPKRFSLGVVNCQMFETGSYAAYRHLAQEDLDLVLHLGDYIYEYPGGLGAYTPSRKSAPDAGPTDLASYRVRHASYRLDPDLAAAHARHPFALTWDDHDVANNYMGDVLPGATPEQVMARRQGAYQAWWEHLPVRLDPPVDGSLAVYRGFDIGDLARLSLLDERQDAAEPPCRDTSTPSLDYGDCPDRTVGHRTRLGTDQDTWVAKQFATSKATWNLLGNPVVLAGVDGGTGTEPDAYYLDTWDGFPAARIQLIDHLSKASNPVVLTGDYHAGMVLDVHRTPFDQSSEVVAAELMSPPISSVLFSADVSARTPQLRQQLNAHGYLTVDVTPDRLTGRFRTLAEVTDPKTTISTAATWHVDPGNPVATKA